MQFFAIPFLLLLLPFEGWVVSQLWTWFFVPFGLPTIGVFHAIGIMVFMAFFKTNKTPDNYLKAIVDRTVTMLIYLALGALAHYLMVSW